MRLIYIANIRLPTEKAHGFQIMKTCEALARQGLDIELVVPYRFRAIKKDPFEYYGVMRLFRIRKLPSLDLIPLDKVLGKLAFFVQAISFAKMVWFYSLFNRGAIIYTRDIFSVLFLKNYIIEVHALPKKLSLMHRRALSRARGIVVVTSFLGKAIQDAGIEKPTVVVPDSVDARIFDISTSKEEARQELGLPNDTFIIGYMGKFTTMGDEKGIGVVFDAVSKLRNMHPNIFFVGVGGQLKEIQEYEQLAKTHDIQKSVELIGHVPQETLALYQKACDVLVMPFPYSYHYAYEMSPMKMFEYMASHRPIIASRLPAVEEILQDNESALLYTPGDINDFMKKIEYCINNPTEAFHIAENAHQQIGRYSWEERAKKIKSIL